MRKTPWSQQSSTLPSDRLAPKRTPTPSKQNQGKNGGKGKGGSNDAELKSKEVQKLEEIMKNVKNEGNGKNVDPKGGCFCQARTHPLSLYTPICFTCGLPLCSVNLPGYACPSCSGSLLSTPSDRAVLVLRLEDEIGTQKRKEEQERERREEEVRQAAGAFPTLPPNRSLPSSTPGTRVPVQAPVPQQYKVLSLGAKGKRPVLTTTTTRPASTPGSATGSPAGSRPSSPPVTRIPPPVDMDRVHGESAKVEQGRPWRNLKAVREGREMVYVPAKKAAAVKGTAEEEDAGGAEVEGGGKKSRRKRGKGKEKENVP